MSRRAVAGGAAALVAVVVAALALLVGKDADGRGAVERDAVTAPVEAPGPAEVELTGSTAETRERLAAVRGSDAPPVVDAAPSAPSATSAARMRGRVLDLAGAAVAGVAVAPRDEPDVRLATSAADGSFDLDGAPPALVVADARWYTLRETEPRTRADGSEVLVIVAPAIVVGGRVLDAERRPVEDARVRLELSYAVYAAFPVPLDHARESRLAETLSAADGSFELTLPSAPRARLEASASGYRDAAVDPGLASRADVELVLERAGVSSLRVEGVVLHADETPAAGATVRYGDASATAESDGRFALTIEPGEEGQPLVAAKKGFQAAVVPGFHAIVLASGARIPPQRLVLGGAPLSIEGRVVDHEGRAQAGWLVQPVDPLLVTDGRIPPECVEALARGEAVQAKTDATGAFALDGLQERAYRLQAHSATELVRIESEPIAAGARNVRLVVPADARFAKVEGVVVGLDGTPIQGVTVHAGLIVFRSRWGYTSEHGDETTTDAEGRFELLRVPRLQSKLDAGGDAILPTSHDLEGHVDGAPVRIVAARRCHARVEGVPAATGLRWVQVHDADARALSLMQFQSGGWMSSTQVELVEGASPVFAVSEAARSLVISGQDQPDVTRPIALVPGEITTVRW